MGVIVSVPDCCLAAHRGHELRLLSAAKQLGVDAQMDGTCYYGLRWLVA